ncbi:MAG: DUF599 domain-containing protein [Rickettsiales bacterium]|nr:DUF599 domain-containing protein [Rickettsiales bacterium]
MNHVIQIDNGLFVHTLDLSAFIWFCFAWFGYGTLTHRIHTKDSRENLLAIMHQYRIHWMRQMLKRENRMPDMTGVANLVRSISFFASTSIFLVLGSIGIMGYREQSQELIDAIPFAMDTSPFIWELKVALLILIFVNAFFKYTWTLRQYNYVTIYFGAAPGTHEHLDQHEIYAQRGADMMTTAARHFNLGLRAYYYGFAVMSWFVHPIAFILSTTIVVWVLYRREIISGVDFTLRRDDPIFRQKAQDV